MRAVSRAAGSDHYCDAGEIAVDVIPLQPPLEGHLCAAARRPSDDGVTDAVMDGADVGIVGEGIVGDVL